MLSFEDLHPLQLDDGGIFTSQFGGDKGNQTLHNRVASAVRPLGTCAPM